MKEALDQIGRMPRLIRVFAGGKLKFRYVAAQMSDMPSTLYFFVLFEAFVPVNNFSVILGWLPGFNQY